MSEHTHILELLPAYALGSLDGDEPAYVADHLQNCDRCRVELAALEAAVGKLALAAPETAPPPELKGRLMARVKTPPARPAARPRSSLRPLGQRFSPVWSVASVFLIFGLAVVSLLLWQRVNDIESGLEAGGSMQALPLSGAEGAPDARAYVIVSADGRNGALVVDNLPVLDPEQEYQLWLIQEGKRTSGALLSVDEDGYGGTRIRAPKPLFEYTEADVTIEPAGGSPSPTGAKVLGGKLFDS